MPLPELLTKAPGGHTAEKLLGIGASFTPPGKYGAYSTNNTYLKYSSEGVSPSQEGSRGHENRF